MAAGERVLPRAHPLTNTPDDARNSGRADAGARRRRLRHRAATLHNVVQQPHCRGSTSAAAASSL
eukprot:1843919-Prymnesium_polylepis.1